MTWTDRALLFVPAYGALIAPAPIGLVDCGARGDIPEPWASFERANPNLLRVLGFEADPAEAKQLNARFAPQRRYVPSAAWNSQGTHDLYITHPPQTSSLFPPNDTLTHFHAPSGNRFINIPGGRVLQRVVQVPTTTIDAAITTQPFDADMLKIDTQGAEYEILEGARETLETSLFAVVAETWTAEIYQGVKPSWEVMRLMADRGYEYMTHDIAGLSRRSFADAATFGFIQREQIISLELLFFRKAKAFVRNAASPAKAYKAVGIADVFGFADYGVEVLREIVMRWPEELAHVQTCFNEITTRRSLGGAPLNALYPKLHG